MRVVFDADNSLRVYFKYGSNIKPKNYTYLLDKKSATLRYDSKTGYYLEVKNIAADKLGENHTFTVKDSKNTYTVTANVLSYARSLANDSDKNTQNLAKALYLYNQKAIAYAAAQ